ncbi:DUF1828 domain-containing protein [Marinobacter nauticus]|uniref:DUF1828 domain-containing protein n=1 Tax=Marinobacter nauticus TaxID=2743 RepID=A0A833JSJ6_MARNT|nr:DUF1828 domain-containing protein [Marinobacter nauticus]KAE8545380.1 hypothetical protein F6453_2352 [Marinobacter nauticus]
MDAKLLQSELCKGFYISATEVGGLSISTPFTYEDGDSVVIFVLPLKDGTFRVDDNGEAAFRLLSDGVSIEKGKPQAWLKSLESSHQVYWDEVGEELFAVANSIVAVAGAAMRVAECSAQMQVLSAFRQDRKVSDFKDQIMAVLREVEQETQIEARYDFAADPNQQIFVDAYFMSKTPISVVVATSAERLMEAELLWSMSQQMKDPMRVIAVFEDMTKFNDKQLARASYYTDKAVPWRSMPTAFRKLMTTEVKGKH